MGTHMKGNRLVLASISLVALSAEVRKQAAGSHGTVYFSTGDRAGVI